MIVLTVFAFLHGVLCAATPPAVAADSRLTRHIALTSLLGKEGLSPLAWLRRGAEAWELAASKLVDTDPSAAADFSLVPRFSMHMLSSKRVASPTAGQCAGLLAGVYVYLWASLCVQPP